MIDRLVEFIQAHPRLLVLTGAGCSAGCGIPTYRDDQGVWRRSTPIRHQDFLSRSASRQRYWARSFAGWPPVRDASPGPAHQALASLESRGLVSLLVTQNVDRLHQRAGHRQVVDLHGRLDQVLCLDCGHLSSRDDMQRLLVERNPHLAGAAPADLLAPDGDAEVAASLVAGLQVPGCRFCGGILKPNVVFFGDSVPRSLVGYLFERLEECDGLLVVGSSLMVFSGFRFCRHAAQQGKPIACINRGRTRADELFSLKVEQECGAVLEELAGAVVG